MYVTVTVCAAVITVVHGCVVPKQPPPVQLVKVDPAAGVEYKLTTAPLKKVPEHEPLTPAGASEQLIPSTGAVTVPLPVIPVAGWRLKTNCPVPLLNVAVTVVFAVSVNAHVLPVEHPPPLHAPKAEPLPGVSPNVICVPLANVAEQVPVRVPVTFVQFVVPRPPTVPYPGPASTIVTSKFVVGTNVAVTLCAEFIAIPHDPVVPLHGPLQPANVEPAAGVSFTVIVDPAVKFPVQVVGQLIPLGWLVTVPLPAPESVTVAG